MYLITNNLLPALRDTVSLIGGHTAPRKPYSAGAVVVPAWEPIAGFAAVFVLLAALPAGLLRARRSCRRAPMAVATVRGHSLPVQLAAASRPGRCRHIGSVLGVRLHRPGLRYRTAVHRISVETVRQARIRARRT